MKRKTSEKQNRGFTLVEMLAVTAIVVILLAVGMVAVVRYARWLRITELDNSAREIYMAAENRAVLLSASGRLGARVMEKGQKLELSAESKAAVPLAAGEGAAQAAELHYIYWDPDGGAVLEELLPEGTIDPALRKGCFYVVYELKTNRTDKTQSGLGSVTDVFYAEEGDSWGDTTDFKTFYLRWRNSSRQDRLDAKQMIGYYGGEAAGNGTSDSLKAPQLEVINGEELIVRLTYSVPQDEKRAAKVLLNYDGHKVSLDELTEGKWWTQETETDLIKGTVTYTCTWVLDTLKEDGPRFQDLFADGFLPTGKPDSFGGDFTVTARITSETVASPDVVNGPHNSLFADGSGEKTAYIENLRHLQNLDKEFSNAGGKTAAVQTADIDCAASVFTDYKFVPIENDELNSYCGSHNKEGDETVTHFIKGLTVVPDSAGDKNGGLFSTVNGKEKTWSFQDVRLINAAVEAGSGKASGALAGSATNASFVNCWVYWEAEGRELRELLMESGGTRKYQIVGSYAGGLVGELNGGTIQNCLAATLVQGTNAAGGLVGRASETVTVENSYADCCLTAPTAAGLIGDAAGGVELKIDLKNVYAAGFINSVEKSAAGLCNANGGPVTAKNAYSVMHYENTGTASLKPLADGIVQNGTNNCWYVYINGANPGTQYKEMTEDSFLKKMNGEVAGGVFARKEISDSHPYNLLDGMALTVYPFPGLKELPHYGDWNSKFIEPALVYYEQYQQTGKASEYGFYGGGVNSLKKDGEIKEGYTVPLDGYAVAFRGEDLNDKATLDITFTYTVRNEAGGTKSENVTVPYKEADLIQVRHEDPETKKTELYYLAPLPDEAINSKYAAAEFYQVIRFSLDGGEETASIYSPHFAKTAVTMPKGMTEEQIQASIAGLGTKVQVSVRTPRHLRALSEFEAYYHAGKNEGFGDDEKWVGYAYTFVQELDLDYRTYEGYGWKEAMWTQDPIGRHIAPFNGVYDGGCHTIRNVRFRIPDSSGRQYAGLFGLSAGTLRNIVYFLDPKSPISVSREGVNLYMGGLAGGNNGAIENCAVSGVNLDGRIVSGAEAYLGGLVGQNAGIIRNSAAETAMLYMEASQFSKGYAGGLVGRNTNSVPGISNCYAVGHVEGKAGNGSEARVCGFVGVNSGAIRDCYAAVWLASSGAGVETYGFCGEKMGVQANTWFVNRGNLSYRGEPYNSTYAIRDNTKAKPTSYRDLINGEKQLLQSMSLGGTAVEGNPGDNKFPLPTGVKDRNGQAVHYGQWPTELDLGIMGVYYWEKMKLPAATEDGRWEVYSVSMLSVDTDTDKREVFKTSTLNTAHSSGGKVVDYGYGYYYEGENEVTHKAEGILCTMDGNTGKVLWTDDALTAGIEVTEANDELAKLMVGYTFHSYRSFVPNPDPDQEGNFVTESGNEEDNTRGGLYAVGIKSTPNGTITLTQGTVSATFEINPHFADALSIREMPDDYKVNESLKISPGTAEGNPYEVRAMGQLSAINWNRKALDTKTIVQVEVEKNNARNIGNFPYLSSSDETGKYFWLQTYDIQGEKDADGKTYKTYTPIAEYYDNTDGDSGTLEGWFGGAFDGDDYMIENVNIKGQQASCAGLFGMVYQGTLNSIILYSSDGEGVIGTDANKAGSETQSRWYAMGALAGMVGSSNISNCSVAGYKIDATVYTSSGDNIDKAWGGNNIGGLIGATDGGLSNCAAVTTIDVHDATENDNMRVGGLVGVSQGTISNCYAGGSISFGKNVTVQRNNRFIYVGGLVAGSYMKPLKVVNENEFVGINPGDNDAKSKTSNVLKNCYSYVTLPSQDAAGKKTDGRYKILALYAVGGTGEINKDGTEDRKFSYSNNGGSAANHGTCTITNCYYLESEVMKNNKDGIYTVGYPGSTIKSDLKTDLNLTRDSVQEVPLGENNQPLKINGGAFVERRISLTSDDVGREFVLSYKLNDSGWTYYKSLTLGGKTYLYYGDNASSCVPIFMVSTEKTHPTNDSRYVIFQGWATTNGSGNVTGWTTDPMTLPVNDWNSLMAITYKQLSDENMCDRLNSGITGDAKKFAPVTVRDVEGHIVPGKYSFGSDPKLMGLRYPFPTILTRDGGADGTVHVHYGNWPLNGIERPQMGDAPIELNMLGTSSSSETLKLSDGVKPGGSWSAAEVESARRPEDGNLEKPIATAACAKDGRLTVTGLKAGQTKIQVTYKEPGGGVFTVDITVKVTAVLRVRPKFLPIIVFPGDLVTVPLVLCDEQGIELTPEKQAQVKVDRIEVVTPELLSAGQGNPEEPNLTVKAAVDEAIVEKYAGKAPETLPVRVYYTHTPTGSDKGTQYNELSTLAVRMEKLPEPVAGDDVVMKITFPEYSVDVAGEAGTIVPKQVQAVVTEVTAPKPVTPPEGGTETPPEEPKAEWTDNVVTLKNCPPGSTVEITVKLELGLVEDPDGKTAHEVTLRVEIPKPEEEPEETPSGSQNPGADLEAEP